MKYDIIFSVATDAIRSKAMTGANIIPDDTVCVLITNTDKTYTGFSRTDVRDGKLVAGCSEKEAVKNLLSDNDNITAISAIVTLNCITQMPVLPCPDCVDLIVEMNEQNADTLVICPDKNYIKITDVDKYIIDGDNTEIESIDEIIMSDPLIMASPIKDVMNVNSGISQSPFIKENKIKPLYYYPDSPDQTPVIYQQESVDAQPYQQNDNSFQYNNNNSGYQVPYQQNMNNSQYVEQQYTNMPYSGSQYNNMQYSNSQYSNQPYQNPQYGNSQYNNMQYSNSQYINSQYIQGVSSTQYINPVRINTPQQFIPDTSPSDDDNNDDDLLQSKLNDLLKSGYDD